MLPRLHRAEPDIFQPHEDPLFKRRRPDEPLAAEPGAPLPAGLSIPDQGAMQGHPPGTSEAVDNGLGVPPFRPAQPQEVPTMSRPPFTTTPTPQPAAAAVQPTPRPGIGPIRGPARDPSERRTLVVGRGISVQGVVQDAERLVVEGTVEATMIQASELSVAPGGMFKGEVEVEDAEIAGTIDGTLTVKGSLIVRATGKVLGTARYRRLQVEDGGQITGRMEMITEPARAAAEPSSGE